MKKRKMSQIYLLKRFLPYFGRYKLMLTMDLICASLTAVCEIVFPLLAREISNAAIYDTANLTISLIMKITVFYLVLRIIDTAANYYMANSGHVMGVKIETDMRRDLFAHLQKLSFSYYSNTKVGQIMGRITSDLFDITEFAHHAPEEIFIVGFKLIASFIILANTNLLLTGIIFALIPIMLFCSLRYRGRMRDAFKEQRHQIGELNAQVEDSLLGIRVVKSFANEEIEKAKFEQGNDRFKAIKKRGYRYMAAFQSTTRFFDGLMYILTVAAAGVFMVYGKINAADLMTYLLYISTLLGSIKVLVNFSEQFERGMTGIERFVEIMDTKPDIVDKPDAIEVESLRGDIEFKNVSFRYDDGEDKVLENISISVQAGESIALVGPSGGGKTTLCNLIPRFYEVTDGEILLDGTNINNMTLSSLRNQIGVVMQDVYMFSGRVRDNIEYGKPGASLDEIKAAAEKAGAAEFIEKLPDGYDTYVGERGVKLSGGQKQRISIARVFLKNPPVLILDEATSALDNESERIVQKSLDELAKGRTVFTIAHRLSTIKNADNILVLTENGIEESGTHEELLSKKGLYYHLYNI